ncbi:CDP-alcohol phosphatidyltransferase family protein [Aidingimonas halophila]|uniref:Phosphatidylglycerophosphate synthase n=1 Tax=Aidingimonas halophila TaxID=574349 RepID=A0A1H3EKQ9_9GAMM|nr:CDP-alcohol phosphatidyltransferase family protein [Aidingimonas halophila]GHC31285.1 membrane protein [Aidingimonas halophila]SDX79170.1 Phosphatidylglycerophosphate synthase [Aidingimonas halophila]
MLDRWTMPLTQTPLNWLARTLVRCRVTPTQVTVGGFMVGMLSVPLLAWELYGWALIAILINRLADGLDGSLARRSERASDAGGFLDIGLDFLFYAAVVLGFALADPVANGVAAAILMFSFVGTGSSFLAFAIMAAKHQLERPHFEQKAFYYLHGLTEGTETVLAFVVFCLWPSLFPWTAMVFAAACLITTATRLYGGYWTLKQQESHH